MVEMEEEGGGEGEGERKRKRNGVDDGEEGGYCDAHPVTAGNSGDFWLVSLRHHS